MERAELPVQRNRTLKCRGVTSFSSAEQAGGIQPLTSISRKHASSSYYSLLALISVALQSRDNLVSLPAAIGALSEKHHYTGMNPVPQAAKGTEALFPVLHERGRILEGPMEPLRDSRKHRALLSCPVTNSDHEFKLAPRKLRQRLRAMAGDIDAQFSHDLDGFAAYLRWLRSSRVHFKSFVGFVSKQPFRNLTARGISRTQN